MRRGARFVAILPATTTPARNDSWIGRRRGVILLMPQHKDRGIFLRATRDIEYVKRRGRRSSTVLFNLLAARMEESPTRVGIVVGKRFGDAVRRNRVKRVFRELARALGEQFLPGYGIVVFPKREALQQPFTELKQQWEAALRRSGVLQPRAN